jgi:membrane dipeptidase
MEPQQEPKKRWDGYTSYDYLVPGEDYRRFEVQPQIGRVEPSWVPLSSEDEVRADRLWRGSICVSLHEHGGILPLDWAENDAYLRQARESYGYEGIAASGIDAVFENFFDGTGTITSPNGWKWDDVIYDIGMHFADMAHQTTMFLGTTVADIERAHETGRIAMIASIEGAAPIENELDRLDILYGLGVRMIGVTYSESNQLGGGIRDPADGGLTTFGRKAVTRMNRLGMAVDLSHTGDVTAMQTCARSTAPVFLSHSGARALFPEMKLKTDELLRAVADTGGVIGIEASPGTTTLPDVRQSIETVMAHMEYCIDVMGIDHVAFGPDTLFGDHVELGRVYADNLNSGDEPETVEIDHVAGWENPSEFPNAIRWLVAHGYTDEQIEKLVGGNVIRALRDVWV